MSTEPKPRSVSRRRKDRLKRDAATKARATLLADVATFVRTMPSTRRPSEIADALQAHFATEVRS